MPHDDAPRWVSLLDHHEYLEEFWSRLPAATAAGQWMAWDQRRHALVLADDQRRRPVDHAMAHAWLSSVAQSVTVQGALVRPLTIAQSRLILDSIRHQIGHDIIHGIQTVDPLVDRWRSTQWDGQRRLGQPLWCSPATDLIEDSAYLHGDPRCHDPFGMRSHILTKIYMEIIGRSCNMHWPSMDETLIIVGPQGVGKSLLGPSIVGSEFSRVLSSGFEASSSYDAVSTLCSAGIVEFEEMNIIKQMSPEAIKTLMTRTHLTARSPRSLTEVRFRRLYVGYGTSNHLRCIPPSTAGRRWVPVHIGHPNMDLLWDSDGSVGRWISRYSDQLGAEALHLLSGLPPDVLPDVLYPSIQRLTEGEQRTGQAPFVLCTEAETEYAELIDEVLAACPVVQKSPVHLSWWRQALAPLGCRGRAVTTALRAAGWRQTWVGSASRRQRVWVSEVWDATCQEVLRPTQQPTQQPTQRWDPHRYDWRAVLARMGVDEGLLDGRNRPCPNCGGTDRFQWLDRPDGGWHCRHCGGKNHDGGGGSGLDMVMRLRPQWSVAEAMRQVSAIKTD